MHQTKNPKLCSSKTCRCDSFTGPVPETSHTFVASCVSLQAGGADTSCSTHCKHIIYTLSATLSNIQNYFTYGCEKHTVRLKECVFRHVFDRPRSETSFKQLREMSYALKRGISISGERNSNPSVNRIRQEK